MKRSKSVVLLVVLAALLWNRSASANNVVVDWNNIASTTIVTNGLKPSVTSGVWFAYVQLAVYDAVNAIDRRHKPYLFTTNAPARASRDAAAIAAAHRILVNYFPSQSASLDAQYLTSIAALTDNPFAVAAGASVGEQSARAMIAARANDGLNASVAYTPPIGPGYWQPTPPALAPPLTPWLGHVTPFTMTEPAQFLPDEGPTPLNSRQWIDDYNQTKTLGAANSAVRTPEQSETGLFWTEHTGQQYARAFRQLATQRSLDTAETARLFATLWAGFADAGIGCWNAKYTFGFWRPVTAIRAGGGKPLLEADPAWTPLAATPAHPEYPAAHGCVTGVVAETLKAYFRTPNVPLSMSSTVTNTTHTFSNVIDLQREVFGARIYVGFHYHRSLVQGFKMGHEVAHQMRRNFFRKSHRSRR
ncbi:MAG TPA: vanadium-dependent haloperoxidase [Terriglobia bacterium]|nr:vanadium-dependent haloperoxidase [Terriglobia bacterium]